MPTPRHDVATPSRVPVPVFVAEPGRWWIALAAWALLVGASLLTTVENIRRHNRDVATEGARNIFRMAVITRRWNANHGRVYVPVSDGLRPNPWLRHDQRDVETTGGETLTMINPAFMTRLIAEIAERDGRMGIHITSLKPIRPENAADPWERVALTDFEQGKAEAVTVDGEGEAARLRFMAPLRVESACLKCHADQGYRIGDIRGGISVSLPWSPIAAATAHGIRDAAIAHAAIFILIAALGGWGLSVLRQRWLALDQTIDTLDAARDELIAQEKMVSLGQLVAGFAHEINTPVGVACGALSQSEVALARLEALMQRDEVSEQEIAEVLAMLRASGQLATLNLRRLANLVQSFKRTSIDRSTDDPRPFRLREVIEDVVLSLHNPLRQAAAEVSVECPADLSLIGHPGLIEQLLSNLIMNAVTHAFPAAHRPGRITITAWLDDDGRLSIRFADDGAGMEDATRRRIFEPFFTTRRGQGGTGLGLYLCHNLVTARLGGSIGCESHPGAGTRFLIRFPVDVDRSAQASPLATAIDAAPEVGRQTAEGAVP